MVDFTQRGLFVTGTDTGVGNTRISAILAHQLNLRGLMVRPRKPVESGCLRGENGLIPVDAATLQAAAGSHELLAQICPYRFESALSPERAAALVDKNLTLDDVAAVCRKSVAESDFLLVERALAKHAESACPVIVEPLVQRAGSMRMYHLAYLTLLREACERYGVHLIADEIAVGFGRTGTLFACEQAFISLDFICLSKGLIGGYLPLSAVLTIDTVYQAFYDDSIPEMHWVAGRYLQLSACFSSRIYLATIAGWRLPWPKQSNASRIIPTSPKFGKPA